MAQGARQSSLFAAEDFSVVYESFSQANFQAYDFNTIRNAMVDYIRNNYPEDFNDWITSSEFVSLIELLAFLGHNLAFRADLASRENYLSTAERRESALRIAEFLGYTPTRNVVSEGYLKINSVRTTERLFDVEGNSLANQEIYFEDVTDPDTYQNFLTIMNAVFANSSQFGTPFSKANLNGIQNEIYRTKTVNNRITEKFTSTVSGQRLGFELISLNYNQNDAVIEERTPEPNKAFDILYRNDNSGFSSPNTGFFMGFKQGELHYEDFNIQTGFSNMVIDINQENIANGNVWVQSVTNTGTVIKNWTLVDRQYGTNAIFNSINNNTRDIFTVSSREDDQISIVFGDGSFGNIPRGIIRVWYRTGANTSYVINPNNMSSITKQFSYTGLDGNTYNVTFNLSLKETVSNASERESLKSIKDNAGRFFASQDRMVTASDYSLFPLTVSENVRKIKSINRVHSGHSRFRDFYDPTATYSDASMYTDDGYIYKNDTTVSSVISLPTTTTPEQIFEKNIKPLLSDSEVKNFYYERHHYELENTVFDAGTDYSDTTDAITVFNNDNSDTNVYRWNQATYGNNSSTGYLTYNGFVQRLGDTGSYPMKKIKVNSIVEFITSPYKKGYIKEIQIVDDGSGYTSPPTVTINGSGSDAVATANINSGVVTSITISNSGYNYDSSTTVTISGGGGSGATARVVVADADTQWVRVSSLVNDGLGLEDSTGQPTGLTTDSRGAISVNGVIPSGARIRRILPSWATDIYGSIKDDIISKLTNNLSFGLRYHVASQEWRVINSSDLPSSSLINPSFWNRTYEGDQTSTGRDQSWIIRVNYLSDRWEFLTRKTQYIFGSDKKIRFNNLNFGETFSSQTLKPLRDNIEILDINTKSANNSSPIGSKFKFNITGYFNYSDGYTDPHKVRLTLDDPDNDGFPNSPDAFKLINNTQTITMGDVSENGYTYNVLTTTGDNLTIHNGRSSLHTRFNRIADLNQVIDPSRTNIIDTYVLLTSYDNLYRRWAYYDGREYTKPNPPTVYELSTLFKTLNSKKVISDQIIYRPVKYKIIFGELASSELQVRFNVTKTVNSTMSDTEIKQSVISLINDYFSIENWDFGETFYFTEMAAYIHNNMIGQISQINIQNSDGSNSNLYEINSESDELFLPVVKTSDITVERTLNVNQTTIAANSGVNNR